MKSYKLQRFTPLSVGRIGALMGGLMGLLIGLPVSLASFFGFVLADGEEQTGAAIFGVGAIILLPLLYAVGGFIGGLIQAWFYNVLARFVGGIEVEVSELDTTTAAVPDSPPNAAPTGPGASEPV